MFWVCLVLLGMYGLYMIPADRAPDEMEAAYFVLTTSEFEKLLFVIGLFGTPTFAIMYRYARYKRKAVLILLPDRIEIDDYKKITSYQLTEITDIACNDALAPDGFPKGKLSISFKDRFTKTTTMTLIDYCQSDQLIETLVGYQDIKLKLTDLHTHPEFFDR